MSHGNPKVPPRARAVLACGLALACLGEGKEAPDPHPGRAMPGHAAAHVSTVAAASEEPAAPGEAAREEASGAPPSFELRHGVIVDGTRGALYLGEPEKGIEAVEISTGRSLWRSVDAAVPLALNGRVLAAQGEEAMPAARLPIVVLDVGAGGRKVLDALVVLPPDVRPLVADELGRSFRVTAERDEDGFLISWSLKESQVLGIARPPGEPPPERTLSGAARVSVETGRVVALEGAAAPSRPRIDSAAERVRDSQALPQAPWRAGTVLAITEGGRGGPLTLKRWDAGTGKALPDRPLMAKALVALPSADRKHLLASERVGTGGPGDPEYGWSIFSLETGERLGEARRDVSAAPFFVWKDCVVYVSPPYGFRSDDRWIEEPLKIRAVRLAGGDPVWDRAVRDLEYRGPMPPVR